jgi:hypothetical protein
MSRRLKIVALVWGLLWLAVGGIAWLAFLGLGLSRSSGWRTSLGAMVPLLAGVAGGGLVTLSTVRSLAKRPAGPFRLPPTWALAGGFVLALAAGLGFWRIDLSRPFLMPLFAAAAGALAPLAVIGWLAGRQEGRVNTRQGWVALGLGSTASTSLAYVLNLLVPAAVLYLVFGLADTMLPLAEDLLDALQFGPLTEELLSPWFLVALIELALVAPLVEELVKPLPLLPLLKRLDSPRQALLVGALAGAGFAAVENLLYAAAFGSGWGGVLAMRAMGAALHPFGAGLMAVAWWRVLRQEPGGATGWVRTYGLAAGVHALWNGTCVLATTLAHTWFQGWEVDLLGVTDGAVMLALLAAQGIGLLVALRAVARRLEPTSEREEESAAPAALPAERTIALWGVACLVTLVPVGLGVLQTLW